MSAKKATKTLLEYDPLCWLKEDNGEKAATARKKSTIKKPTGRKAASKKKSAVKKAKTARPETKKTTPVKKKAVASNQSPVEKITSVKPEGPDDSIHAKATEETGFGFFNTNDKPVAEVAVENENFGFFEDGPADSNDSVVEPVVDGEIINLGFELTIRNVAELKQQILASMANESDIRLDPSELQKIDASGLQMLYSLQKTLAKSSQQLHWSGRNPVLDSAAELIGMSGLVDTSNSITLNQDQGFGFF